MENQPGRQDLGAGLVGRVWGQGAELGLLQGIPTSTKSSAPGFQCGQGKG